MRLTFDDRITPELGPESQGFGPEFFCLLTQTVCLERMVERLLDRTQDSVAEGGQ